MKRLPSPHIVTFLCVLRSFKTYFLSNFQVYINYNHCAALWGLLDLRNVLITGSLYRLTTFTHCPSSPPRRQEPPNYCCSYELGFFVCFQILHRNGIIQNLSFSALSHLV